MVNDLTIATYDIRDNDQYKDLVKAIDLNAQV
jgi:hypothetical protein